MRILRSSIRGRKHHGGSNVERDPCSWLLDDEQPTSNSKFLVDEREYVGTSINSSSFQSPCLPSSTPTLNLEIPTKLVNTNLSLTPKHSISEDMQTSSRTNFTKTGRELIDPINTSRRDHIEVASPTMRTSSPSGANKIILRERKELTMSKTSKISQFRATIEEKQQILSEKKYDKENVKTHVTTANAFNKNNSKSHNFIKTDDEKLLSHKSPKNSRSQPPTCSLPDWSSLADRVKSKNVVTDEAPVVEPLSSENDFETDFSFESLSLFEGASDMVLASVAEEEEEEPEEFEDDIEFSGSTENLIKYVIKEPNVKTIKSSCEMNCLNQSDLFQETYKYPNSSNLCTQHKGCIDLDYGYKELGTKAPTKCVNNNKEMGSLGNIGSALNLSPKRSTFTMNILPEEKSHTSENKYIVGSLDEKVAFALQEIEKLKEALKESESRRQDAEKRLEQQQTLHHIKRNYEVNENLSKSPLPEFPVLWECSETNSQSTGSTSLASDNHFVEESSSKLKPLNSDSFDLHWHGRDSSSISSLSMPMQDKNCLKNLLCKARRSKTSEF